MDGIQKNNVMENIRALVLFITYNCIFAVYQRQIYFRYHQRFAKLQQSGQVVYSAVSGEL